MQSKGGMVRVKKIKYERFGMGTHTNGVSCGAVEWVKINTLRWFGHTERMESKEFVKKMYVSECGSQQHRKATWKMEGQSKRVTCGRGAAM